MSTFYRVGTANMYDATLRNLGARQSNLVGLQENLTSGKRVVRASDDPVAAAQAERALTRISRIQSEQRALELQRNAVAQAESTMGDAIGLVQEMRQLIIAAGGGTLKPEDRRTYTNQIQSLREQLTQVINRKDTNGIPLLGALGSALEPFVGPLTSDPDYAFAGQPGQNTGTNVSVPTTMDGHSAFMFNPQRDGVYNAAISNSNAATPLSGRQFTTTAVSVQNAAQIQPNPTPPNDPYTYSVSFTNVTTNADGTFNATYQVSSNNPNFVPPAAVTRSNLSADKANEFPIQITDPGGATLSFSITARAAKDTSGALTLSPATGDTVTLQASPSILSSLDSAIRGIGDATNNNAATQAVGQALAAVDAGMERMQAMRGYAGEQLNRADRIMGDQDSRSIQLEADRSRAVDLDMVKGISDFQNSQVGYQAALQSYAMVQKLSLFNFIS